MQEAQITAPIGMHIQGRYVIEDLLGQGGFSAVYAVRDRKIGGKRFALKVLKDQSRAERERFAFESEVLKRLHHPALPSVSHMFEDNNQICMLMEFIDGSNLERLRQQQAERRFALSAVLPLLAPIVDAVSYLHSQPIPVLHRDIKPANIIVQKESGKAFLVDFGIAKEYHPDTTTTAIRHCSAGYSAPEQYSGVGTDPRSDIYSLAATCYTLVTGNVPLDALQRTTLFVTKGRDALPAIEELVPGFPVHVAHVIQRALSINAEKRYATVVEFWQALEHATTQQDLLETLPDIHPSARKRVLAGSGRTQGDAPTPVSKASERKKRPSGSHTRPFPMVVLTITTILFLLGGGIALSAFLISKHTSNITPVHSVKDKKIATVVPLPQGLLELAPQYRGTVRDLFTNATTEMTLVNVQQSRQVVSGNFAGMQRKSLFSGVLDTSKHLFFTIGAVKGQPSLFFEGAIRSDGNLVGNYCSQDASGQCVGDYGIWSVAPFSR